MRRTAISVHRDSRLRLGIQSSKPLLEPAVTVPVSRSMKGAILEWGGILFAATSSVIAAYWVASLFTNTVDFKLSYQSDSSYVQITSHSGNFVWHALFQEFHDSMDRDPVNSAWRLPGFSYRRTGFFDGSSVSLRMSFLIPLSVSVLLTGLCVRGFYQSASKRTAA